MQLLTLINLITDANKDAYANADTNANAYLDCNTRARLFKTNDVVS